MATIKTINDLFRNGQYDEAFAMALSDWQQDSNNIWAQRKMGWAYTFMLKQDIQQNNYEHFVQHLEAFLQLDLLCTDDDSPIFETLLWRIVVMPLTHEQRSAILLKIAPIDFPSCDAYSALLNKWMKQDQWRDLLAFIDWWNLSKLQIADYHPTSYTNEEGETVKMISLAEQAYINYSKLLLQTRNKDGIRNFIPRIEQLTDNHPEMLYPGYFCGKLMLALDVDDKDILKRVIPFVKRKSRDFWAWQLLSEVFDQEPEKQLACLLRAVDCCHKEDFLNKVRTQIATIYAKMNDYPRAVFHIQKALHTYQKKQWRIAPQLFALLQQPWVSTTQPNSTPSLDFLTITNQLVGIPSRPTMPLSKQEAKTITGKVTANKAKTALFVKDNNLFAFIPASLATKVKEGDLVRAKIVPTLDKKRNKMGLSCISIEHYYYEHPSKETTSEYDLEVVTLETLPSERYFDEFDNLPY